MPMGQTNSHELQTKYFVERISGNTSVEYPWEFFEVTLSNTKLQVALRKVVEYLLVGYR